MKKNYWIRLFSLLFAIVLMMACTTTAFADFGYSDNKYETVDGIEYYFYSLIHNEVKGQINFQTTIAPTDRDATIPTGAMGVCAKLYKSSGALVTSTEWDYSDWTNGTQVLLQSDSYTPTAGGFFYSQGQVKIYNGKGYTTFTSYATANFTTRSSMPPVDVPVTKNENGEIYGSELFLNQIGVHPDLILVEGIDGTVGYVRSNELNNDGVLTPADAIESMKNRENRLIPVYMSDGETVIGLYEISMGKSK